MTENEETNRPASLIDNIGETVMEITGWNWKQALVALVFIGFCVIGWIVFLVWVLDQVGVI